MEANIISNFKSPKRMVTIGIIIVILISAIIYKLYTESEYDMYGNKLSVSDTFKNMCGLLPSIQTIKNTISDTSSNLKSTAKKISKKLKRRKEVFNIDNNVFTYEQAEKVCKAYDAKLANYNQLKKAHKQGANWCNYGWSANQMALYPIQKEFHENIEKSPNTKGTCGNVGVNGGVFANKNLKFGVNCYGYKPHGDPNKLIYYKDQTSNNTDNLKEPVKKKKDVFKDLIKRKKIEVRPFNNSKWSKYSYKKSRYMLSPKNSLNMIIEEEISENSKDPRTVENTHQQKDSLKTEKQSIDLSADVL